MKANDNEMHNIQSVIIEENYMTTKNSFPFSNLQEIKDKATHTLNTANEWQYEQQRREELINKKIQMQSEHIRCRCQREILMAFLRFVIVCFCINVILYLVLC